jgi:hypothetical protein
MQSITSPFPKIEQIARVFNATRIGPGRYRGFCAAHHSLDIRIGRHGILIACRSGCRTRDVLRNAKLRWSDLSFDSPATPLSLLARHPGCAQAAPCDDTICQPHRADPVSRVVN